MPILVVVVGADVVGDDEDFMVFVLEVVVDS
jgi:hypothetical protein